jgi:hypothetical protein
MIEEVKMTYITIKRKRYQLSQENFKVIVARTIAGFIIFAFITVKGMIDGSLTDDKVEYSKQELDEVLESFRKDGIISFDGNIVADVKRKKLLTVLKIPTPF